jgi:pilus assembly protein Flp/PilA
MSRLFINFIQEIAMKGFMGAMKAFWNDEEGLTVVEYAVAGGLISAAVVTAFFNLGGTVNGIITNLNASLGG